MNNGEHFDALMNFLIYQETGECEPCQAIPEGGKGKFQASYAPTVALDEPAYKSLQFTASTSVEVIYD
tara:strand:+ start:10837 stop:11040 length:204 start_codon:yes stop_codon:yes gene_type:complete